MAKFIPLSVPNFGGHEKEYVNEAVVSEWVSTGGSKVADFEKAIAQRKEIAAAVKAAGFMYAALDLEGFRSGSLNAALKK